MPVMFQRAANAAALLALVGAPAFATQLTGTVRDAGGQPVAGALVVATSETALTDAHGVARRWIATSDAAGHFAFDGFPAGACHVTANAGAGRVGVAAAPCAVKSSDAAVDLPVSVSAQAAHIRGQVRHAPQDPAAAGDLVLLARVSADGDAAMVVLAAPVADGAWAIDLPAGTWMAKAATAAGESRVLPLAVPGQVGPVVLSVSPTHPAHPEIARELHAMAEKDQAVRDALIAGGKYDDASTRPMARVDRANLARLEQIVRRHGWPDAAMVGNAGVGDFWLLAQHAPGDFIAQALPHLKAAADRGEIAWSTLALMIDRDLMDRGQPQVYGSQWNGSGQAMQLYKVVDPEHLDERRAQVGLGPIAEYEALLRKQYP